MKISVAKREYLTEIEVRKFTLKTIKSYRNNLNLFLRFCEEEAGISEVEELTLSVVRQFSLYMSGKGRKGSYINGLLKVAKAFIQYCYDEGYGGFNTRKNFKWCKQDKAVIMAFKPSDVRRMLQSCKGYDFLQVRDAAVLTALFETGIRCWELCCIQKKDIPMRCCTVSCNTFLTLTGTGRGEKRINCKFLPVLLKNKKSVIIMVLSSKKKARIT